MSMFALSGPLKNGLPEIPAAIDALDDVLHHRHPRN
jgi:hypothetical protein